ncbi:MAG TPA: cation diffusion facilitator family transporter [Nocardioidaceae bacterium]|nr:cation diffusion facilitator family transporter [Nocardioidaceae bacterium]
MGAGHGHFHDARAGHAGGRYRSRLAAAFALVSGFFAVELVTGIVSGSLALISDAGHMAADVVALGAALVATKIATRPDSTGRRTYGSYRAEVFASGLTVLIMLGVAAYVVIEAISRINGEPDVASTPMLVVGAIGLGINIACMLLLRAGSRQSLNVKGAYFEVVADAAGSVGVMIAGVLVMFTGKGLWDTLVALTIGIFVAVRALVLGRQVLAVLGQHVPEGMMLAEVVADLESVSGVGGIHDLHIWTLTSGMNVATAHIVVGDGVAVQDVLTEAQRVLAERHHIEHATLQVEEAPTSRCHEVNW